MKGAKYILTAAVIAMSSVMMTGCFKPSKDAVVESKYYQSLKDERDKLSEFCSNEYSCLQICKEDCNWM